MVRKLRDEGLTDIALKEVAHVGIRTRTRARAEEAMAAAANSTLAKRRKINSEEVENISSCIQPRNRTINNSAETVSSEYRCSSTGLELFDHDRASTSCCSSHGSSDERIEFVDLEVKLNSVMN